MYDDAQDAVAAEYVLGTLSADEREHAEALIAIDPGFAEAVQLWERRLGELNVMVEAVEPPPELWDKISSKVSPAASSAPFGLAPPPVASTESATPAVMPPFMAAPTAAEDEVKEALSRVAALASSLSQPSAAPSEESAMVASTEVMSAALARGLDAPAVSEPTPLPEPKNERSADRADGADIVYLSARIKLWRRMTALSGAIAALLALFAATAVFAPQLLPGRKPAVQVAAPAPASQSTQFVAVLQQEPTAPAFLLTIDPNKRTLVVRRVLASAEAGRSYELWLISGRFPTPRSLGIVGDQEFTQRAIPGVFDLDTIRQARYAISLEPAGGSPSGVPTGPILFTGKMVESVPEAAQPRT